MAVCSGSLGSLGSGATDSRCCLITEISSGGGWGITDWKRGARGVALLPAPMLPSPVVQSKLTMFKLYGNEQNAYIVLLDINKSNTKTKNMTNKTCYACV